MKYIFFILIIFVAVSCNKNNPEKHNNHAHAHEIPSMAITEFTENIEIFAEFQAFVVGDTSKFAAHINSLTDFKPYSKGTLKVTLQNEKNKIENSIDLPNPIGIFRPFIIPTEAGVYQLIFEFKLDTLNEKIVVDSLIVYPDAHTAIHEIPEEKPNSDEISFLKEQAWKADFATMELIPTNFNEIIRATGEIQSSQSDEIILIAKSSGIVIFQKKSLVPGMAVNAGMNLFIISGADLTINNIENQFATAKVKYKNSEQNYGRALELVKTKAISEKDFQEYKSEFQKDSIIYHKLAKNISQKGVKIKNPTSGFIQNLYVSEGQYVEAGTPLASVVKNKKLVVKVDVSMQYQNSLYQIETANFKQQFSNKIYNLSDLNGKLLSVGKSVREEYFIPVFFEITNNGEFIDGSFIDVYIKSRVVLNQIVVPKSAVIEEQGKHFVYVQTGGESFEKRYITINFFDGNNYAVSKGIKFSERVVTEGSYYIKLSSMSGTLPIHGHAH